MASRLNSPDTGVFKVKEILNFLGLASCWAAVIADIIYFALSSNFLGFVVGAMYTPLRYFLFDMSPNKLQKRPASLDRSIPLTIFVHYLTVVFPMPHGNFLATLAGFFLACGRAAVNGYGLLFFDTFSWFYSVKNDANGIPLDDVITADEDEEDSEEEDEEASEQNSQVVEDGEIKLTGNSVSQNQPSVADWQARQIMHQLTQWDFPLRRYKAKPNYYFDNNEVNATTLISTDQKEEKKS